MSAELKKIMDKVEIEEAKAALGEARARQIEARLRMEKNKSELKTFLQPDLKPARRR